ncbi:twin-arginine translocation signal domain-containing protein [Chloroflexota bacterium]
MRQVPSGKRGARAPACAGSPTLSRRGFLRLIGAASAGVALGCWDSRPPRPILPARKWPGPAELSWRT